MSGCDEFRSVWMLWFDDEDGGELPAALAEHLVWCPGCAELAEAAQQGRRLVRSLPLGAVDTARDAALLAALQGPVRRPGVVEGVLAWLLPVRSGRAVRRLALAGAGSFVGTLLVAILLTRIAGSDPTPLKGTPGLRGGTDLAARLDRRLALQAPSALPARPAVPRPASPVVPPRAPEQRSDRRERRSVI